MNFDIFDVLTGIEGGAADSMVLLKTGKVGCDSSELAIIGPPGNRATAT
jgi:hypothetical protein